MQIFPSFSSLSVFVETEKKSDKQNERTTEKGANNSQIQLLSIQSIRISVVESVIYTKTRAHFALYSRAGKKWKYGILN